MTVASKKVQNADESDEQNLVAVEPTCAVFAQRILNGNQVKQTASVVFTNNTNRKLIFVIRPSKGQAFVIRPLVDFLMPGKSRSVIISMRCDAVEPGKKHSIEFLVTPLPRLCGAGMEATKYFEKNKSAILANAKIGHISCLETAQSDAALQRITSIPSLRPLSTVSTSEVESVLKYGKFVVLRAPTSKRKESPPNQANSPEYERSPPNALRTRSIREISGAGGSEVEHLEKRAVCAQVDMRMDAATDDHFWQSSHTLRAFCYGFITSFIIMFIIILSI